LALGWALEVAGGAPLEKLCESHVFAPLGLTRTFFLNALEPEALERRRDGIPFVATERCEHRHEVNCGVVNDDNAYAVGGVAGHAGVFSTADEVARLGQAWLEAYQGRSTFLSLENAERFATRDSTPGSTRALGWDLPSATGSSLGERLGRGERGAIGHLGWTGTSLWIDLDDALVCVLLTNRVHPSRANERIKQFRPRFHDAVASALGI
jgi:CubicO group peptidase (beta-lactamase class C family)